ncbi:S8 family serine peptidase, partial [Mycobacterium tuberculosis]|nr:S8 family serine peptidase [Mycobacterium tuberculosis]
LIAAGNIRVDLSPADHLVRNDIEPLDDPAQAWNAITVGAFTNEVDVIDAPFAGYAPIAPAGELSPASRTSVTWDRQWPVKPDIVMEGGNLAHDGVNPGEPIDDLRILTTHFRPENRYFSTIGDTSSAT